MPVLTLWLLADDSVINAHSVSLSVDNRVTHTRSVLARPRLVSIVILPSSASFLSAAFHALLRRWALVLRLSARSVICGSLSRVAMIANPQRSDSILSGVVSTHITGLV